MYPLLVPHGDGTRYCQGATLNSIQRKKTFFVVVVFEVQWIQLASMPRAERRDPKGNTRGSKNGIATLGVLQMTLEDRIKSRKDGVADEVVDEDLKKMTEYFRSGLHPR